MEVRVSKDGLEYTLLDDVRSTSYAIPKLRVMHLDVDVAKKDFIPRFEDPIDRIRFQIDGQEVAIDYGDEATKLLQLAYAVKELDPDVIVTSVGDSYLFPYLIQRANANEVLDQFILSRDHKPFNYKTPTPAGHTYFSYGHTFYRASRTVVWAKYISKK